MHMSLLKCVSYTVSLKEIQRNLMGARATDGKPRVILILHLIGNPKIVTN